MKARALLSLLVVAALALLVARIIPPARQAVPKNPASNEAAEASNPMLGSQADSDSTTTAKPQPPPRPRQPQRENAADAQGNWASEPLPPGSNLQERLEELARRRGVPLNVLTQQALAHWSNVFSQELNRPMEFYGKAVDESGVPLNGVTATISCVVFPENQFITNIPTGANGLFALHGVTGQALAASVTKQGYEEVRGNNEHFFTYYGAASGFMPDSNNPIIFHLRKKGAGTELITSRHGISPELEIIGLHDGSAVRVNFFDQKVGGEGQMELSAVKPPRGQAATEWSFRMSIPDGGFIEENDEFPYDAPESGYQPTVDFHFKAGETNWTDTLHKQYYIAFGVPRK